MFNFWKKTAPKVAATGSVPHKDPVNKFFENLATMAEQGSLTFTENKDGNIRHVAIHLGTPGPDSRLLGLSFLQIEDIQDDQKEVFFSCWKNIQTGEVDNGKLYPELQVALNRRPLRGHHVKALRPHILKAVIPATVESLLATTALSKLLE